MPMFKKLILLGRPASGKSEFIDFIKKLSPQKRLEEFYIGKITELDDFVWLWEKFVEDDLWEEAGHQRHFSKRSEHGYVITNEGLLDFCLERFNGEVLKCPTDGTVFIEFARGRAHKGYKYALNKLSSSLLKDAALLFIHTSYEEACRRNEARYQEKLKHSVLAHKVPEEDMIKFGKEIDWEELTEERPHGFLNLKGLSLPFVTMNNEPELKDEPGLSQRYQQALDQLSKLYKEGT